MSIRFILSILLAISLAVPCLASDGKVVLATLEWPPYTGENLPRQGASSIIVREAFKAVGLDVEIRFYPWNRMINELLYDPEIQAYFPEYSGRESLFHYSRSIGKSPIGFAKLVSETRSWDTYEDLEKFRIGVVSGYMNTPRFDAMMKAGELHTNMANQDLFNLRKVLEGRVDLAVVDSNVYTYFMRTDPFLFARRSEMRMDKHLMDVNELYVCFPRSEEGQKLQGLFNEGLEQVDVQRVQDEYMNGIENWIRENAPKRIQ